METNKNPLLFYRAKKNEVHTPEEIQAAFENSYAICFDIEKSNPGPGAKMKLFSAIWEINPDTIIIEADLCEFTLSPIVLRKQILLINKNGTKEITNQIGKLISESGVVKTAYCFFSKKVAGIKKCCRISFTDNKSSVVKKGNLLIDEGNLLLTVRTITSRDRKSTENT